MDGQSPATTASFHTNIEDIAHATQAPLQNIATVDENNQSLGPQMNVLLPTATQTRAESGPKQLRRKEFPMLFSFIALQPQRHIQNNMENSDLTICSPT